MFCFIYASAQAGRGKARLSGVVVDEAGKPIASAKVVIEFLQGQSAQRELTSDKNGEWVVLGLGSGNCKITVTAAGFAPTSTDIFVSQIEMNPKVTLTLRKMEQTTAPVLKDEATLDLIESANKLFAERNFDEAISLLEQFLAQNPTVYQAHILIGDCYREKGDYGKAVEVYNISIETAKKDEIMGKEMAAKALAGIGDCYLRKQDFETAQKFFRQSIDTYPDNEALAYNVGEIYFANQKLDEAIQYFTLASQIKPTWGTPYYKLGLVYLNKADYEMAKTSLNKFLQLEPNTELAQTVKNILEQLEKIKK